MKAIMSYKLATGLAVAATLALAGGAVHAQTQATAPATDTAPASTAQLQREHQRAVKAGDTANDPMNSASSDTLNQAQLQGAPLPDNGASDAGGPVAPAPDASAQPAPPADPSTTAPGSTDDGTTSGAMAPAPAPAPQ